MENQKQIFFISSIKNESINKTIEIDKSFTQYKLPLELIDKQYQISINSGYIEQNEKGEYELFVKTINDTTKDSFLITYTGILLIKKAIFQTGARETI